MLFLRKVVSRRRRHPLNRSGNSKSENEESGRLQKKMRKAGNQESMPRLFLPSCFPYFLVLPEPRMEHRLNTSGVSSVPFFSVSSVTLWLELCPGGSKQSF